MSDQKYILSDGQLKPVDLITWAKWFETADRRISSSDVRDPAGHRWRISTVFLGLDQSLGREGDPLLFETMIFSLDEGASRWLDHYCTRYATLEEAKAGHIEAREFARAGHLPAPELEKES